MQNENNLEVIKLLLIGDMAVGNSSMMLRYTDDTFNSYLTGTSGVDLKKKISLLGGKIF